MPALDSIDRIGRIQQRIRELEEAKEIDPKRFNVVLGDYGTGAFEAAWKLQQALRKVKKPAALNMDETPVAMLKPGNGKPLQATLYAPCRTAKDLHHFLGHQP